MMDFSVNCNITLKYRKNKELKISSIFTYLILIAGVQKLFSFIRHSIFGFLWSSITGSWTGQGIWSRNSTFSKSSIFQDSWPSMKQIFRSVLCSKQKLLNINDFETNKLKTVILYGACSHMGTLMSNLMVKYGFSVILVDASL